MENHQHRPWRACRLLEPEPLRCGRHTCICFREGELHHAPPSGRPGHWEIKHSPLGLTKMAALWKLGQRQVYQSPVLTLRKSHKNHSVLSSWLMLILSSGSVAASSVTTAATTMS